MSFVNSQLYDGIKVFSWLADLTGLPIDMVSVLLFHARHFFYHSAKMLRTNLARLFAQTKRMCCIWQRFYLHAASPKQNSTWRNPCASGNRLVINHFMISFPKLMKYILLYARSLYEKKHSLRNGKHAKFSHPDSFLMEYVLFMFINDVLNIFDRCVMSFVGYVCVSLMGKCNSEAIG